MERKQLEILAREPQLHLPDDAEQGFRKEQCPEKDHRRD